MKKFIKIKSKKGITIVSLVVTVIVLIILAGISINALVGDNGIIDKAQEQKDSIEREQEELDEELKRYKDALANGGETSTYTATGLQEKIEEYLEFKRIIADGLTTAGAPTSETETANQMAQKIIDLANIASLTEATAKKAEILSGKTAWVNGEKLTGEMKNFSSNIQTVNAAASNATTEVDITDGFHTKIKVNGKPAYDAGVTAGTAAGTAAAKVGTAGAGDVLAGKTFTNSTKVGETGTMKNFSSNIQTVNAAASNATTEVDITDGFHTKIKVNGKPAYDAGKAAGVTEGTAAGTAAAKVGTATAGDVLAGKTFTNGSKIGETGTMANVAAVDPAKSISKSGDYLYARMTNGAHITNASSGYPEVRIAMSEFGDAAATSVLNGAYFTSTAGVKVKGTMQNFSSNIQTVNAAASDATTEVDITDGYHTKIKVNGKPAYDAGKAAGVTEGTAAAKVGTAGAADVLAGKTFTNSSKVGETGTMATLTKDNFTGAHSSEIAGEASNYTVTSSKAGYVPNGTQVASLAATTSPTIATTGATGTKTINVKPGYYNKISVNQTAAYNAGVTKGTNDTKVGTAGAADVLAGKTFTNSSKVGETGTMATLTSENFATAHSSETAGEASNYTVTSSKAGYVPNGTQVASLAATTSPTIATTGETGTKTINVKPGYYNKISVNQTAAYNAGVTKGTNDTKVGTAGAGDVLEGKTFTNSSKVGETGTMPKIANGTLVKGRGVSSDGTNFYWYIPTGYYEKTSTEEAYIKDAKSNYGDAAAGDVLTGKYFTSTAGIKVKGTMPDNSTKTSNGTVPGINSNYADIPTRESDNLQIGTDTSGTSRINMRVPKGYWPGSGYVNRPASDFGDAAAGNVLNGKYFTSTAGIKVKGTMADYSSSIRTVTANAKTGTQEYDIADGYHTKIKVNQTAAYNAGKAAVPSLSWSKVAQTNTLGAIKGTETLTYTATADGYVYGFASAREDNMTLGANIGGTSVTSYTISQTYMTSIITKICKITKGQKFNLTIKNTESDPYALNRQAAILFAAQ